MSNLGMSWGIVCASLTLAACGSHSTEPLLGSEVEKSSDAIPSSVLSEKDQVSLDDRWLFATEKHKYGTCATFNFKGLVDDDVMSTFIVAYPLEDRFNSPEAKQYVNDLLQRECRGESLSVFSGSGDDVLDQFFRRTDSSLFCINYGFLDSPSVERLARAAIFQTGYEPTDSSISDLAYRLKEEISAQCGS